MAYYNCMNHKQRVDYAKVKNICLMKGKPRGTSSCPHLRRTSSKRLFPKGDKTRYVGPKTLQLEEC